MAEHKYICTKVLVCVLILYAFFCRAMAENSTDGPDAESSLQIYLPREVTIEGDILKLGRIGIVRGPEKLLAAANEVSLGRISVPGQEIVIERNVILSRLANEGISSSKVTLLGAEKITIKQRRKIISDDEFVTLAEKFIKDNISDKSVSQWNPILKPKDMIIPEPDKNIRFSSEFVRSGVRNQAKVKIVVYSAEKQIGDRDVTFRLQYNVRTAIASVDIPEGAIITRDNVRIETKPSSNPEPDGWTPPYGQTAKRALSENTVIQPYMIGSVESQTVVKRNQNVVIRIEKPGFMITAVGKAMQDGKVGEYIKVRNIDSQRIIIAKINQDTTVAPVF
ncbi:MAG: flagellar basal body P-ring formation protein FlgA [Sedimentisphaerales bacterium]|nr:flagellar basal body P-ring formation protein FlgA [Sedimentisphaerales bacterium]